MITAKTKVCMVIGDPVEHSLSPLIHNAGYRAAGIDDQFVYVACAVNPGNIPMLACGVRALGIRGVSCTMPHKEAIMSHLDSIDEVAQTIGAVNTVVQENGKLVGYNTDWLGVVRPLQAITDLHGKRAAVLGAGGAAKAMVYGLLREGATVTICNRTETKAMALAEQFGCKAASLESPDITQADIICNATSVGMGRSEGQSPVDSSLLAPHQIVLDAIYVPMQTKLLQDAAACGARCVPGTEMLLHQAAAQFELYTGHTAPLDAMRQALQEELQHA